MNNPRRAPPRQPPRTIRQQRLGRGPYPPRRGSAGPPWRAIVLIVAGALTLGLVALVFARLLLPGRPAPAVETAAPQASAVAAATRIPASAVSPLPASTTATLEPAASVIDIPVLQQYMVELINADRRNQKLGEAAWESIAAIAGQNHAEEMASFGYISHLDLDGHGPDYRYSLARGLYSVRENVYLSSSSGYAPRDLDAWRASVRQAEAALMNSPGHRANILDPAHTHIGIGIAYDAPSGRLAIVQEFTGHYVALDPPPLTASVGAHLNITGRVLAGSNPLLSVAYEPAPSPKTIAELNASGSFSSPAESYAATPLAVGADGSFSAPVTLDSGGRAGLYHVRVFVDAAGGQTLANDIVIEAR